MIVCVSSHGGSLHASPACVVATCKHPLKHPLYPSLTFTFLLNEYARTNHGRLLQAKTKGSLRSRRCTQLKEHTWEQGPVQSAALHTMFPGGRGLYCYCNTSSAIFVPWQPMLMHARMCQLVCRCTHARLRRLSSTLQSYIGALAVHISAPAVARCSLSHSLSVLVSVPACLYV